MELRRREPGGPSVFIPVNKQRGRHRYASSRAATRSSRLICFPGCCGIAAISQMKLVQAGGNPPHVSTSHSEHASGRWRRKVWSANARTRAGNFPKVKCSSRGGSGITSSSHSATSFSPSLHIRVSLRAKMLSVAEFFQKWHTFNQIISFYSVIITRC